MYITTNYIYLSYFEIINQRFIHQWTELKLIHVTSLYTYKLLLISWTGLHWFILLYTIFSWFGDLDLKWTETVVFTNTKPVIWRRLRLKNDIPDMLTMPDVVYTYGYNLGYGLGFGGPYVLPSYLADTSFSKFFFQIFV